MPDKVLERKEDRVVFTDAQGNKTEVKLSDLPANIIQQLAVYGLYTKLSKSRAGKQNPDQAVYDTISALKGGKWTVSGTEGRVPPNIRVVFQTLMNTVPSLPDRKTKVSVLKTQCDTIKKMPAELKAELERAFGLKLSEICG